jgi:SPP1 family predicted phage head-tail adaptor
VPKPCEKYLPAKMDKQVTIQSVTQTTDDQGGFTEAWATFATVWAYVRPVKGYERFQAQQLQTPVTHKLTVRYLAGVTTKHRILFDSRVFEIKEVINVEEQNAFLELICIEIA